MASNAKPVKDKPHSTRLVPRATAASAARAARNAMNRNLYTTSDVLKNPPARVRPATSPSKSSKLKSDHASPSKPDVKVPLSPERRKYSEPSANHVPLSPERRKYSEPSANHAPESSESFVIDDDESKTVVAVVSIVQDMMVIDPAIDGQDNLESLTDNTYDSGLDLAPTGQAETPLNSRPVTPRSRPVTPRSRPITPKSHPQTSNRPTTPAHPGARTYSRPTTPASATVTRRSPMSSQPPTPQKSAPHASPHPLQSTNSNPTLSSPQPMNQQPVCSPVQEEDIKMVFTEKQKTYQRMKKDLDIKQRALLEVFDSLRNLNERLTKEGLGSGEGVQLQDLVVFNVADWSSDEVAQLCRDAANNEESLELTSNLNQIDEETFAELDSNISKVPAQFADLCLEAFTARQELIDWVKDLIGNVEDGRGECFERVAQYNNQGLQLCEALRNVKACADNAVETVTQISRCALRERKTLLSVGESLVRQVARLREDMDARTLVIKDVQNCNDDNTEPNMIQELRRQLEEERASGTNTKNKLATAEAQLRQTRMRVTKMDRQLKEAEASIVNLTNTVKTLEEQSRQREVQLEARARKLKESLKTSEVTTSQIVQQRDLLLAEVQSLKENLEKTTTENKNTVQNMERQIKALKASFEEQRSLTESEIEKNKALEQTLAENTNIIEKLNAKLSENEKSAELPTEREIDLWAELQATKETLRITEDEVTACKREKVRFLETLTKIHESENKIGLQQKLAAELLSKEEIIGKMQIQIRELTKNIKLNEQKVIQYEQYVRNLQASNRAAADCQEAPNGISYDDLQQEIMNLRMCLLDAVHRNEELSEVLSQKEHQIEQQDKTSRAQARIIKVREELINMLKNKETEQSKELSALQQDLEHRMKVVDEVNMQIAAKADEIQELFTTLENKQQQIHRLEKIVLALEEQQRRAQAQRTRHEEKIAALEHELAAGRRDRKFLFF